eukprot:1195674-Rhodomonas_salina.1
MEARRRYAFGFEVRNPSTDQASPAVRVNATSKIFSIFEDYVSKLGEPLLGVTGGTDPMRVVVPIFSTSVIQSTPVARARNLITVSLETSVELSAEDNSVITIS